MSEFKTKFDGRQQGHRFKMLQLIHGLSLEINTGIKVSSRGSILQHAKQIGWISEDIRFKKVALGRLVEDAKQGFGYVPTERIKQAIRKPRKASKKSKKLV
jgi:hypothetical protein